MKWLRFRAGGRERFGVLAGDRVQAWDGDMFGAKQPNGEEFTVEAIEWLTPTQPSKMIGLWNNFRAAAEKNGNAIPPEPLYFIKGANSYCAHKQPVMVPKSHDGRIIYEGELAVVIGKTASGVSVEQAPAHICLLYTSPSPRD